VCRHAVRTPGTVERLDLRLDERGRRFGAAGKDVAFLHAELRDAAGTLAPDAWENVFFGATGNVTLVGANPYSSEAGVASILVQTETTGPRGAVYALSLVREGERTRILAGAVPVGGDVEPFEIRATAGGAALLVGSTPVVRADAAAPKFRVAGSRPPARNG
jgi:hypothetical protein